MAGNEPAVWRGNEPISTAGPTPTDERHSRELETFLRTSGLYPSIEDARLREEVRPTLICYSSTRGKGE